MKLRVDRLCHDSNPNFHNYVVYVNPVTAILHCCKNLDCFDYVCVSVRDRLLSLLGLFRLLPFSASTLAAPISQSFDPTTG